MHWFKTSSRRISCTCSGGVAISPPLSFPLARAGQGHLEGRVCRDLQSEKSGTRNTPSGIWTAGGGGHGSSNELVGCQLISGSVPDSRWLQSRRKDVVLASWCCEFRVYFSLALWAWCLMLDVWCGLCCVWLQGGWGVWTTLSGFLGRLVGCPRR